MTTRSEISVPESLAEGIRFALALTAMILLARSNRGAIEQETASAVAWLLGGVVWAGACIAVRGPRLAHQSPIHRWRDCIAPALITLIIGGGDSESELLATCLAMFVGCLVVGFASYWPQIPRANLNETFGLAGMDSEQTINHGCRQSHSPAQECDPNTLQATCHTTDHDFTTMTSTPVAGDDPRPPATTPEQPSPTIRFPGDEQPVVIPDCTFEPGPRETEDGQEQRLKESLECHVAAIAPATDSPVESWARSDTESGVSIEAVVIARFEVGAKLAVLHLPFVPPLSQIPEIDYEPLEAGSDVTIRAEAVFRHGARLSISRRTANDREMVPIGVMIYTNDHQTVECSDQ